MLDRKKTLAQLPDDDMDDEQKAELTNETMSAHHPSDSKSFRNSFAFVQSPYFLLFIQTVIIINVVVVVVEASLYENDHSQSPNRKPRSWEYLFFVIYLFEALFKLVFYGGKGYFASKWNTFDFVILVASFAGLLLQQVGFASHGPAVGPIFRSIRLWRVLRVRKSFRHVLLTMSFLFRHMTRYVVVLMIINYFFAIIGMMAFANTVSKECIKPSIDCGSEYATGDNTGYYEMQNFDNLFLSYNTLFTLMVVNNWQLVMV